MEASIYNWEQITLTDQSKLNSLAKELGNLHPILTKILIQRGIDTFEKAEKFFRPSMDYLHDPFLMKDMKRAAERLTSAISNGENIRIYGDYDVDGVTSVSMVYDFLKDHHKNMDYYIPDRYNEGYGISIQGIDDAAAKGVNLIIALDCGIKAVDKIEHANSLGIDFIICDHHEPGEKLPEAYAVLDPKRNDCDYPYKELSGCGVGFKLLQAFSRLNDLPESELQHCLDLLAVSIAADIVPITGENRVLAYFGTQLLNENPRAGLHSMIDSAEIKHDLSITDIVFKIAPKINAVGRLKSATTAVEMLTAAHKDDADITGIFIQKQNESRKKLDKQITEEALMMIRQDDQHEIKNSTVLYHPEWHKGVIGIVASRVIEHFYKPTIILTSSNGKITGSARSVKGFNVYAAIEKCSEHLEQFGGHMYAAGLTLLEENLESFKDEFEKVVSKSILPEQLIPTCEVDAVLKLGDLNAKFYRILSQFAPFGPGNMNPVFQSDNLLCSKHKVVGGSHLKMTVFDPSEPDKLFESIAFGMGGKEKYLGSGVPISIVYSVEENHWNGRSTLQLNIKDIKF